jgi:hypothetical protein
MALSDEQRELLRAHDDEFSYTPSGKPRHFDLNGNPIPFSEWVELYEDADAEDRVIGRYDDPRRGLTVSTVWFGIPLDLNPETESPLLFESVVITPVGMAEQMRYATRDEAEAGHEFLVRQYRDGEGANGPLH